MLRVDLHAVLAPAHGAVGNVRARVGGVELGGVVGAVGVGKEETL